MDERHAIHLRHIDIGNDQVECALVDQRERVAAILGFRDGMAVRFENGAHPKALRVEIVYDQQLCHETPRMRRSAPLGLTAATLAGIPASRKAAAPHSLNICIARGPRW